MLFKRRHDSNVYKCLNYKTFLIEHPVSIKITSKMVSNSTVVQSCSVNVYLFQVNNYLQIQWHEAKSAVLMRVLF